MRTRRVVGVAAALLLGAVLAACSDVTQPTAPVAAPRAGMVAAAPSPIVSVSYGGSTLHLWPYTGDNFEGTPVDPINIIIPAGDVRQIRAALLAIDGDRTGAGLPAASPFNCTWADAAGGSNQTAYAEGSGWMGSAIQLTCGPAPYGPVRYHLRLFQAGNWVLGGAHFEMQIPGTQEHEVLSWFRAEQVVAYDLIRAGTLVGTPAPVEVGTDAPFYRTVRKPVWDALVAMQPALAGYAGAVVDGNQVKLPNDGTAMLLPLTFDATAERLVSKEEFQIELGQMVPKPFCQLSAYDYIYVSGMLDGRRQTVVTGSGNYISHVTIKGQLTAVPMNPLTQQPTGDPGFTGVVNDVQRNLVTDKTTHVTLAQTMIMLPNAPGRGSLMLHLRVGPNGTTSYSLTTNCTD